MRVVAVEDDSRYRSSLETLLRMTPGFTLAGSFGSADAALAELDAEEQRGGGGGWDLVLMDLQLPGTSGLEAIRRLRARAPDTTVVALTVFEESGTVLQAICAGADGYLLKRTPPDRLIAELRSVMGGDSPLSAGVARTVLDLLRHLGEGRTKADRAPTRLDLTDREQEVLRGLVQGMGYKQVAAQLGLSLDTIRTHVRNIYAKLQVHSVAEAVSRALREHLV